MRLCVLATLSVVLCASSASSQNVKVDELMTRTAGYVSQFVDQFANVVAEETLVQETSIPRRKRTIKADFLLVRYPGDTEWLQFRDVSEVDGKPVREDQQERLTKLFLEPSESALSATAALTGAATLALMSDIAARSGSSSPASSLSSSRVIGL